MGRIKRSFVPLALARISASHHSSRTWSMCCSLPSWAMRASASAVTNGTATRERDRPRIKVSSNCTPSSRLKLSKNMFMRLPDAPMIIVDSALTRQEARSLSGPWLGGGGGTTP